MPGIGTPNLPAPKTQGQEARAQKRWRAEPELAADQSQPTPDSAAGKPGEWDLEEARSAEPELYMKKQASQLTLMYEKQLRCEVGTESGILSQRLHSSTEQGPEE